MLEQDYGLIRPLIYQDNKSIIVLLEKPKGTRLRKRHLTTRRRIVLDRLYKNNYADIEFLKIDRDVSIHVNRAACRETICIEYKYYNWVKKNFTN